MSVGLTKLHPDFTANTGGPSPGHGPYGMCPKAWAQPGGSAGIIAVSLPGRVGSSSDVDGTVDLMSMSFMTMGMLPAGLGFSLVMGAITWYFLTISVEKVPVSVTPFTGVLVLGMLASLAGVALDPGLLPGGLAAVTVGMGGFVLYLLPLRKLPDGALIAQLGAPMPELIAIDQDGQSVDFADLKGQRVMLKFFRGSW
jgi:hypothetical protein